MKEIQPIGTATWLCSISSTCHVAVSGGRSSSRSSKRIAAIFVVKSAGKDVTAHDQAFGQVVQHDGEDEPRRPPYVFGLSLTAFLGVFYPSIGVALIAAEGNAGLFGHCRTVVVARTVQGARIYVVAEASLREPASRKAARHGEISSMQRPVKVSMTRRCRSIGISKLAKMAC